MKLVVWCDGDHEEDTPSTVVRTLTVDGGKPVLLDLCEVCDKVVQDMIALMEAGVLADKAIAAPTTSKTRRPAPVPEGLPPAKTPGYVPVRADGKDRRDCPECEYVGRTRSAMGQHLKTKHGTLFSNYDWTV